MPSWDDFETWLKRNGWKKLREGRDTIYEKTDSNGNVRRTRVSKGSGEIGKGLFRRILKQQLGIDKDTYDRLK
ncbi:type II toxin-antitoxin system HicA family toxin [Paenibacillus sp.]|uniref:type II toxin-antitoxin system HicA family toxin n=1 Tax=Paenibacillus sp. TaxID=58172 RepID=UPI0039C9E98E